MVLKDKLFCFFSQENLAGFFSFYFFRCFIFHLSGVLIFHLSHVFSIFTFIRCFQFSPFLGVFIFYLSQVFHFSPFPGVFLLLYRKCYGLQLFLLPGVFHLTLLPYICHNSESATSLIELFSVSGIFFWLQGLPLSF